MGIIVPNGSDNQDDGVLYWRSRRNKVHRDRGAEGLVCGAGLRDMAIVPKPGMYADLCAKCFRPGGDA